MKSKKENEYLYKKDPNENYDCESCADHVCNDVCGCKLSESAQKSLEKIRESLEKRKDEK